MRNQKKAGVISALKAAVRSHRILTIGTLLCVAASVVASLIPPLLLKDMIDRLTGGMPLLFTAVLLYFGSLVLEGTLSSAQETLLVLFGQKMTHAEAHRAARQHARRAKSRRGCRALFG